MTKILITGGTGFLGKRLGMYYKAQGAEVVLAGRNHKQLLAAEAATGCLVLPLDVARPEAVRDVFSEVRPQIVIHAAATKFVDLAERHPMEAIDINVIGSQNVARAACEYGAEVVLGISTDKAAPPVKNIYGLSKAMMERMFCALNGKPGDTRFLCVRYGNVAWSTGSVLCIWRDALAAGRPLKSTGQEMLRFFFTVDEAVALVATALEDAQALAGTVLAREMRAAAMGDILRVWASEAGAQVELIPVRPGERTVEYLIGEQELAYTDERLYGRVRHYVISFNKLATLPLAEVLSSANAPRLSDAEIGALIHNPPEDI